MDITLSVNITPQKSYHYPLLYVNQHGLARIKSIDVSYNIMATVGGAQ